MSMIKDRHGMDIREGEDNKKRCKNAQKNYTKNDFHDTDNHNGVIINLQPDILECKVQCVLGRITINKAMEVMEFQLNYFKS